MGIDIVAFLHVLQYVVIVGWHALDLQFLEASLCSNLGCCGHEYLQFGVGEHHGAYVATVHDDAFVFAHLLLFLYEFLSYGRYGGYGTNLLRHLQRADEVFHALPVKIGVGTSCLLVQLEADVDVDDVEAEEGTITVYTAPTDLHKAIVALRESGIEEFQVTELEMIPQSEVELSGEDLETFEKLYSVLEDDEDVQKIYTNVDGF